LGCPEKGSFFGFEDIGVSAVLLFRWLFFLRRDSFAFFLWYNVPKEAYFHEHD
jgi:hypothetical protein